jgi:hypothetical protein
MATPATIDACEKPTELEAFTRDPARLGLVSHEGGGDAQREQPVAYKHATLTPFARTGYEIRMNWHTHVATGYADASDAINGVPCWELQDVRAPLVPTRTRDEYVREVFAFLQRGHSLLEPNCQCYCAPERAWELGVRRYRRGVCLVPRYKQRRSFDEIALELHVRAIDCGHIEGATLLFALTALAGMQVTMVGEARYLHSPLCCISPSLTTAEDLVHAAQMMAPLPYTLPSDMSTQRLLPFLHKNANVFILAEQQLFYKRPHEGHHVADAGIRTLWESETLHSTMQRPLVLDRALSAEGLMPMQTHLPLPVASAVVAKCKRGKRGNNKRHHHFLTMFGK